jgi:hypothetical protein
MYFEGFESTLHAAHGLVAPPIPIDENLSKMLSDVLRVRIMLVNQEHWPVKRYRQYLRYT